MSIFLIDDPTNQALESLDEYIFTQFYKNNKDVLKVYIEDNYWTATKYKRDDYADTKDIIKEDYKILYRCKIRRIKEKMIILVSLYQIMKKILMAV